MTKKGVVSLLIVLLGIILAANIFLSKDDENEAGEVVDNCETKTVDDFKTFLGVAYGNEEYELSAILGTLSGGEYQQDSTTFIYHFNRVERVPIEVWVDSKTGKIITVFMENLSLDDTFKDDLSRAVEEYKISKCDASWYGLSKEEVKKRMGKPAEEATNAEGVSLITYDSENMHYTVTFKFYPQQNGNCSSVSVNWFYQ